MLRPLVSAALGLLLGASALSKFRDPEAFREVLKGYPFASRMPTGSLARLVPAVEAALGLALLSSLPALSVAALEGTLGFLVLATFAVGVRFARGERRFRCGCGGDLSQEHSAAGILLRNGALIALCLLGLSASPPRPISSVERLAFFLFGVGVTLGSGFVGAAMRARRYLEEWKAAG